MFKKVLVANRGEIACRVFQALQEMSITGVAVYSDVDRQSLHVSRADEAYPLGGQTAIESYLNIERIIEVARECGADAIHPGYGFLSENAAFAQACQDAGITFIGPEPRVIKAMGDKIEAKSIMQQAGVPTVPGWSGDHGASLDVIRKAADEIGYPLLVKAAAGGGGKGMRVVDQASDLDASVEAAGREAKAAFGDARIFLEKFIRNPRHIEFQIFGDQKGNVVHLFERECSLQRRHQKIIEEAPSPVVSQELREEMGNAAVRAAKAIGYTNAGTVEFMLDADGSFYFLEVNARLQVEHPVTELITSHDLVRTQLQVAMGLALPFSQEDLTIGGHAIECRIYAEDPWNQYLPSTGTLAHYVPPAGAHVRVDSGVTAGSEVSVHFDPMLAKLIVWGEDREVATLRLQWALQRYVVLGVITNIQFLQFLVTQDFFRTAEFHTQMLDHDPPAKPDVVLDQKTLVAAAASSLMKSNRQPVTGTESSSTVSPWQESGSWRIAR
ncbi:MAG: acetyl-CoA carboxylase biotin carboxylase subunit [Phycisphaerae bacterium]